MFARFFVDRPIFATVLSLVIVIVGLVALTTSAHCPVSRGRPADDPGFGRLSGADAETVATTVATPIEQEVNGVERMLYMASRCTNDGQMFLDVTFELGHRSGHGPGARAEPRFRGRGQTARRCQADRRDHEEEVAQHPAVRQPGLREEAGRQFLLRPALPEQLRLAQREGRPGADQGRGRRDFPWPARLQHAGVARSAEARVAGHDGRRRDQGHPRAERPGRRRPARAAACRRRAPAVPFQLVIKTQGRLSSEEQFDNIIVKTGSKGEVVKLRDVVRKVQRDEHGRIVEKGTELGAKNYDVNSYLDGDPSVTLAVFQLPGSNALKTAEEIKAKMKELKAKFPQGVDYKIVYDTTVFIDESVHEVYKTLFEAFVLVFIVVLVFLQDWRATLMPMIDVPVSLIGTFAVMALLGFSLNNLTLFGLVLAIGIVVDDAIVVVENIERWMAKGLPPREATIKAMDEITGPVIAITLVLSSVFIPTAFLAGITGQFYRQFALTIAASTIISAINAMTMAPARAVTLIKPHVHGQESQREALPRWGHRGG